MPVSADLADQIEPVLIGHPKVTDEHFGIRLLEGLDGFRRARRRRNDSPRFPKHFDESRRASGSSSTTSTRRASSRTSGSPVVEGSSDSSASGSSPLSSVRTARIGRSTVNVDPRPSPSLSPHRPAVQLDQMFHDGKPQSQAAERRRVLLSAWRKRSNT